MVIVWQTDFGNDHCVTLEVESAKTVSSYQDHWTVLVDGKRIYPRDSRTAIPLRGEYKSALRCYEDVVKGIRIFSGRRRCGRCSKYKLNVKQYRVDFKNDEGVDDYYLEKLCESCIDEMKGLPDTKKIALEA